MAVHRAIVTWSELDKDRLTLLECPTPRPYGADPSDDDDRLVLYRTIERSGEAVGTVVGLELDDFLSFDQWELLPTRPRWWQVDDDEPRHLVDLLRMLQARLRAEARVRA